MDMIAPLPPAGGADHTDLDLSSLFPVNLNIYILIVKTYERKPTQYVCPRLSGEDILKLRG